MGRYRNMFAAMPFSRSVLLVSSLVEVALLLMVSGCSSSLSRQPARPLVSTPLPSHSQPSRVGVASWYGPGFHGQPTASGEIYNQNALTAAHRTLPLGTRVEVTNLSNGKSVQVRINDRGPYIRGRSIDLSHGAARKLGMVKKGVSKVRIKPLPAHGSRNGQVAVSQSRKRTTKSTRQVKRPQTQGTSLKSMLATIWPF
jgi:rare lipoprotein A (peptidoglycan hydrolase)